MIQILRINMSDCVNIPSIVHIRGHPKTQLYKNVVKTCKRSSILKFGVMIVFMMTFLLVVIRAELKKEYYIILGVMILMSYLIFPEFRAHKYDQSVDEFTAELKNIYSITSHEDEKYDEIRAKWIERKRMEILQDNLVNATWGGRYYRTILATLVLGTWLMSSISEHGYRGGINAIIDQIKGLYDKYFNEFVSSHTD